MAINFTYHNTRIEKLIKNKKAIKYWIKLLVNTHFQKEIQEINYYFTNDQEILEFNTKYLNHNYYTDIITFNYSANKHLVADIVISVDTVKDNAQAHGVAFEHELLRVIVHGILHIVGFDDRDDAQRLLMRQMENWAIDLYYQKWK